MNYFRSFTLKFVESFCVDDTRCLFFNSTIQIEHRNEYSQINERNEFIFFKSNSNPTNKLLVKIESDFRQQHFMLGGNIQMYIKKKELRSINPSIRCVSRGKVQTMCVKCIFFFISHLMCYCNEHEVHGKFYLHRIINTMRSLRKERKKKRMELRKYGNRQANIKRHVQCL